MKWLKKLIGVLAVGFMMFGITACASNGSYYGASIHQGSSWGSYNYGYHHHRYDRYYSRPPVVHPPPSRPPYRPPMPTPYRAR